MAKPTAALIKDWSNVDFASLGYQEDAALQRLVDRAIAFLAAWTGATWDSSGSYTGVVPALEPLAEAAVQQYTEMIAFRSEDVAETLSDFDLIQSFSAGSYSETRRAPKDTGMAQVMALQGMLWPLMSPDKRDEWQEFIGGPNAPSFAVTEVNWSAGSSYGSMPGDFGNDPGGWGALGSLPSDPWPPLTD